MQYQIDLENYVIKEIPASINEVTIEDLDFDDLSNEINIFNKEIEWKDMWDIDEVKRRLKTGWRFFIYKPIDKIKGWIWLDNKNEPKNIYVNREYRNKGIAKELYFKIHNIAKELGINRLQGNIDNWNMASVKSIKNAGWHQTSPFKIYIHHPYKKSLFYTLCHNSVDRNEKIINDEGSVFCNYKEIEVEFIFKKTISFEDDGYHILDYFAAYFDNENDPKIGKIERDTSFMEKENQQILKIFVKLLKECPSNQKWIITYFRTEKILYSIDSNSDMVNDKVMEIESLLKQLSQHHIVTDNLFLNDKVKLSYPNFYFAFTNSIFQWNQNLNIRYYYEFKQIYDKLNFDYDLMYSVRNHKGFRVELINELNKLKNDKIYLQTSDTLKGNKYYLKYGSSVSNDINVSSIYGDSDFSDISYLQNIINGLDLFFRVLPKAKMQILCESWSDSNQEFNSQYLSEKTIGLILSGIPFISTHEYPLLMLQKILSLPPHPFFNESKKYKSDGKLFAEFVKYFMESFEDNYKLCKEWSDLAFEKFMYKIENDNSLLDLIMENRLQTESIIKKGFI